MQGSVAIKQLVTGIPDGLYLGAKLTRRKILFVGIETLHMCDVSIIERAGE